jgi:hypothetical protein
MTMTDIAAALIAAFLMLAFTAFVIYMMSKIDI